MYFILKAYRFNLADQSLEEFLDEKCLDDPKAKHRLSTESYVRWGRDRSETVLMDRVTKLRFGGR